MWHEDISAVQYASETVVVGPSNSGDLYSLTDGTTFQSAGAGYLPGDVLQLVGGTSSTPATLTVDTVDVAGAITALHVANEGSYTVRPPGNPATTNLGGSGGAGCTVKPVWINPGGLVQLCIADPSRILLSISVGEIAVAWYSTNRMTARNQGAVIVPSVYNRPWLWTYPHDGVVPKLAWFSWCSVDNQHIDVLSVTMPQVPCPTWRDINKARPVAGASTDWSSANGDKLPRPAPDKQSLLVPNWDGIGEDSRP